MENTDKESKKKKKWLIPIMMIVTLIIGGMITFGFTSGKVQAFVKNVKEEKKVETTIPLEEFLVNLAPEQGKSQQFLKIEIAVHSNKKDAQEQIDANIPQIRNAIITVLRKQTADIIYGEDQELTAFKKELATQVNQSLDEPVISEVFITNIIMQ